LFSAKKYAEAEKAYAVVIKQGRSSHFFEQSLYKHGWSLFKQSLTEESLPSFGGVVSVWRKARMSANSCSFKITPSGGIGEIVKFSNPLASSRSPEKRGRVRRRSPF